MRLKKGKKYLINFVDPRQANYTWYTGIGVFLTKSADDFGDNELHYMFKLPNGEEGVFPKSSVVII